jgi:cellulose synthase/poly-beta-1,6-N-acetylglucosamine synthase-like glycosyltransferase
LNCERGKSLFKSVRVRLDTGATVFGAIITAIAGVAFYSQLGDLASEQIAVARYGSAITSIILGLAVFALLWGNIIYFFTRVGRLRREARHRSLSREQLLSLHATELPSLTILVPCYREDELVVSRALISAALLEYPKKRVVLLIDDSPHPSTQDDVRCLLRARQLPAEIQAMIEEPRCRLASELEGAIRRLQNKAADLDRELNGLGLLCNYVGEWFQQAGQNWAVQSHVDAFFVSRVFDEPARQHREHAAYLRRSVDKPLQWNAERLIAEYRRLASFFDAKLSTFERKCFANLSHEPNKAMNLNTYLGLMGKSWRARAQREGCYLEQVPQQQADFVAPESDYVITLDADSVLLSDYALRLVAMMEAPGNERLAVAQTPYSAFPGATKTLERIAGATTDIQHLVHQGLTEFHGTFWVGANALIRRKALIDIAQSETERGFPITVYIQSRTVIEDTESSIDLARRNWRLNNYCDRLAYSETPSDFGSLLIQRRRWSNGGLIILPKLLGYCATRACGLGEALVRIHYLVSPATTNLALLCLLLVPLDENLSIVWLAVAAAPYFVFYGRDLIRAGYSLCDLARVFALNLLLVPVNLGGVLKSLHQAITGRKTPFGRTPKTATRTVAPPAYVAGVLMLWVATIAGIILGYAFGHWRGLAFSLLNSAALSYVVIRLIGPRECLEDLFAAWPGVHRRLGSSLHGDSSERGPSNSTVTEMA